MQMREDITRCKVGVSKRQYDEACAAAKAVQIGSCEGPWQVREPAEQKGANKEPYRAAVLSEV